MTSALEKAFAVMQVESARKDLIERIIEARKAGVSESDLMQILNINNNSYHRLIEKAL